MVFACVWAFCSYDALKNTIESGCRVLKVVVADFLLNRLEDGLKIYAKTMSNFKKM